MKAKVWPVPTGLKSFSRAPRVAAVVATAAAGVLLSSTGSVAATPSGPPSTTPATLTPHLVSTGTTEQIRQLVQCGSTMYAVGTFTEIARGATKYVRNGAFSFSATAPYKVTSWDPEVNGTVNSIAFDGTNCDDAYLGGKFTEIGSTTVKNIAEVHTSTGNVVPTFKSSAAGAVDTLAYAKGHVLAGGNFTGINGSTLAPYFTSLDPTTGHNDHYLALDVSGHYAYTDDNGNTAAPDPTKIYNQQISSDGTKDLVEGVFTSIGGQPRRQAAIIDLTSSAGTIDPWYATEFNANCAIGEAFYARGGAWSTDGQTVYFGTTGYKPANGTGFHTSDPRAGLCDAAVAFPTTAGQVSHQWINYTGCDSMYAAAADATTVYFAGHERWASNANGCDAAGPGAVSAPGIVGLSPSDSSVTYNPTRARGLGADDLLVTSAGLWVASDNAEGSQMCGGATNLAGICFLPYSK